MAKKYTADEMREIADQIDDECADAIADERTIASTFDIDTAQSLRDMLRQAADDMERERRFEYAEKYDDGDVSPIHDSEPIEDKHTLYGSKVVRRSVGEWEEVK